MSIDKDGSTHVGVTPCEGCGEPSTGRDDKGRALCARCLTLEKSSGVLDGPAGSLRTAGEDLAVKHTEGSNG